MCIIVTNYFHMVKLLSEKSTVEEEDIDDVLQHPAEGWNLTYWGEIYTQVGRNGCTRDELEMLVKKINEAKNFDQQE